MGNEINTNLSQKAIETFLADQTSGTNSKILIEGKDDQGRKYLEVADHGVMSWIRVNVFKQKEYKLDNLGTFLTEHAVDLAKDGGIGKENAKKLCDIIHKKVDTYNAKHESKVSTFDYDKCIKMLNDIPPQNPPSGGQPPLKDRDIKPLKQPDIQKSKLEEKQVELFQKDLDKLVGERSEQEKILKEETARVKEKKLPMSSIGLFAKGNIESLDAKINKLKTEIEKLKNPSKVKPTKLEELEKKRDGLLEKKRIMESGFEKGKAKLVPRELTTELEQVEKEIANIKNPPKIEPKKEIKQEKTSNDRVVQQSKTRLQNLGAKERELENLIKKYESQKLGVEGKATLSALKNELYAVKCEKAYIGKTQPKEQEKVKESDLDTKDAKVKEKERKEKKREIERHIDFIAGKDGVDYPKLNFVDKAKLYNLLMEYYDTCGFVAKLQWDLGIRPRVLQGLFNEIDKANG